MLLVLFLPMHVVGILMRRLNYNQGAMSAETMDNDVEPEKEDEQENNANLTGVRAPLASEEDLTAPGVTSFII